MDDYKRMFGLLKIPGHPNLLPPLESLGQVPIFTGLPYEAASMFENFMNFIADLSTIYGDIMMKLFVFTLRGIAAQWFHEEWPRGISSIPDFIKIFCNIYGCQQVLEEFYGRDFCWNLVFREEKGLMRPCWLIKTIPQNWCLTD
jgi:hypothetical protein